MTYTINPAADNSPDEPFHGFELFWSKSYNGAHLAAYREGVALGKTDLEADGRDNLDALLTATILDNDWNAKADGYSYATRSRGPNELRRYA